MAIRQRVEELARCGGVSVEEGSSDPVPEVLERVRPPRQFRAKYKAEILAEYERLDRDGKGALLRREGLYTSLISEWRKQRDRGALAELARSSGRPAADPKDAEIARLNAGLGGRRPSWTKRAR